MLQFLKANVWLVAVFAALVAAAIFFIDPAPPREITLASGPEGGAYDAFARKLAHELANDGLMVHVQNTLGSGENLQLLADDEGEVSIALVQSGLVEKPEDTALHALGSVFPEPVWIFYRRDLELNSLRDLRGSRVVVGGERSGTRPVALAVLRANELLGQGGGDVETIDMDVEQAQAALLAGEVSALFIVSAPESAVVERLVHDPGLSLYGLRRRTAYETEFRRLTTVTIGEGQLDLAENLPREDHVMLAAVATLVVNDRFHPGLAPLVLAAAADVLADGGRLMEPGAFPAEGPTDFELTREAVHFHTYGLPFLMRYVSFWAASMFDRIIIYAIPLLIFLFPVFKVAGPLYRWQTRRRIYRWYENLRAIDQRLRSGAIHETVDADMKNLRDLEHEILSVQVPLSYTDELYELHLHIGWVMSRLDRLKAAEAAAAAAEEEEDGDGGIAAPG